MEYYKSQDGESLVIIEKGIVTKYYKYHDGEVIDLDAPPKVDATGKKVRCCKTCGKPGHRTDGCPKRYSEPQSDTFFDIDGDEFEFSSDDKEIINTMLLEGKGSRDVAEKYGCSVKVANSLIMKAKEL